MKPTEKQFYQSGRLRNRFKVCAILFLLTQGLFILACSISHFLKVMSHWNARFFPLNKGFRPQQRSIWSFMSSQSEILKSSGTTRRGILNGLERGTRFWSGTHLSPAGLSADSSTLHTSALTDTSRLGEEAK